MQERGADVIAAVTQGLLAGCSRDPSPANIVFLLCVPTSHSKTRKDTVVYPRSAAQWQQHSHPSLPSRLLIVGT